MTLQKVWATTILWWVIVAIQETASELGVLPSFSPISLHDLLHILWWVVVPIRETASKLGVLPSFSPISLHDLLHILWWVVVPIRETASELGVLPSFSPISLHNLLHATSDGFGVLRFLISPLRALLYAFCAFKFGLWSFLIFLLLFPCWVFFLYLFICLFCLSCVEISQLTCCSSRAQTETDFHPGSRSYWL